MGNFSLKSIVDSHIRHTNFFNGRLLTADSLQNEQKANQQQRQQIGQALGAGIIKGFEVTLSQAFPPTLSIAAGIAVNGEGAVFELETEVSLEINEISSQQSTGNAVFTTCDNGERELIKNGFSLLVVAPDYSYKELTSQFSVEAGMPSGCGLRYIVEGVKFRQVEINLSDRALISKDLQTAIDIAIDQEDDAGLSLAQNLMAYACLGQLDLLSWPNSFETEGDQAHNLIDRLHLIEAIQVCDVPLALLYQSGSRIIFVDMWAARRRLILDKPFSNLHALSPQQFAVGEATLNQFQSHLQSLTEADGIDQMTLDQYMRYLPPAGLLPRAGFAGDFSPHILNQAAVTSLLHLSFRFPLIDLAGDELPIYFEIEEENGTLLFAGQQFPVLLNHREYTNLLETLGKHEELIESLIGDIGENFVRVPHLVGNILFWAKDILNSIQLDVGRIIDTHAKTVELDLEESDVTGRVIVSQQIQGGQTTRRDSKVNLIVTTNSDDERILKVAGQQSLFDAISADLDIYGRELGFISEFDSMDSNHAFSQLCNGKVDIVLPDRSIRESEVDDCTATGFNPIELRFNRTGVAFFTTERDRNFILGFTKEQLSAIFSDSSPLWGEINSSIDTSLKKAPVKRFILGSNGEAIDGAIDILNGTLFFNRGILEDGGEIFRRRGGIGNILGSRLDNYIVIDSMPRIRGGGNKLELPIGSIGFTIYSESLSKFFPRYGLMLVPLLAPKIAMKSDLTFDHINSTGRRPHALEATLSGKLLPDGHDLAKFKAFDPIYPSSQTINSGIYPFTRSNFMYIDSNLPHKKPIFANMINELIDSYQ